MIAKDLNEESAMRKMDATKLEEELDQVKEERDGLALEVERLRAAAYQHEVQRIEHQMLKGALTEYETDCLCQAKEAILKRDNVIIELSSELERALEAIESGRAKQQQRRQIIFPARMSHPMPSHPQETITLKENLQQAKAEAASAKMKLEQSQQEAEAIILAYKSRVEELEGQIAESSAAMDSR
jgi:DNA-directed RNA polymerase subunit L